MWYLYWEFVTSATLSMSFLLPFKSYVNVRSEKNQSEHAELFLLIPLMFSYALLASTIGSCTLGIWRHLFGLFRCWAGSSACVKNPCSSVTIANACAFECIFVYAYALGFQIGAKLYARTFHLVKWHRLGEWASSPSSDQLLYNPIIRHA